MSTQLNTFTLKLHTGSGKTTSHRCHEVSTPDGYNKIVNDRNEVAVMYSPGYGAGWSTWFYDNPALRKQMTFDSRIIRYKFLGEYSRYNFDEFMTQVIGFKDAPYDGGFADLKIRFIPQGTMFRISEYDGSESVEIFNPDSFMKA